MEHLCVLVQGPFKMTWIVEFIRVYKGPHLLHRMFSAACVTAQTDLLGSGTGHSFKSVGRKWKSVGISRTSNMKALGSTDQLLTSSHLADVLQLHWRI